jgi:MFS transporter, SP family, general alpha glucoside:H+ symporter
MSLFVFLAFFAVSIEMLLASQVLCGLPWGIFQTLSTTYAAEVMPVVLRSYLTSNINMCWLIGQLIGVGVVRAMIHNTSEWSYRIPFGLQWAFAVPILIGVAFAPESPWWLVRNDRLEEAKKSLLRLTSDDDPDFNADETISMMRHTNEVEKYLNGGGVSYLDCFKGTDLRRTEIAAMVWMTQALCGSALTGYAAYFYEQAGFGTANAFNLAVGMYGVAIVGQLLSWIWMRRVGRRTLYLIGLSLSVAILAVGGIVGALPETDGTSWTLGSMIIILTGVYDATIGPVCYVLVAEIPSSRLRVKTVVLARVAYNVVSIVTNVITPRMLNPTAWDLRGKSCFVYCGTTVLCLVWCWFRLPDPFGLTFLELDILFEKRAKARKFREFQVNLASTGYFSLSHGTNLGRSESGAGVWQGYS